MAKAATSVPVTAPRGAGLPEKASDFFLREMDRRMSRFFEDWRWPSASPAESFTGYAYSPKCELAETKTHYLMNFDLPGLSKDDISVAVEGNRITVSGEREREAEEGDERSHYCEMQYGTFVRAFELPTDIDPEKVEATVHDGVLTVRIAKTGQPKAHPIHIN